MPAPEKPSLDGLEQKWSTRWEADGTYRFDRTKTRDEVFSIDTPPPTVSGSLHIGHDVRVHPHRHASPGSSACAAARSSTRWGGTTTACPTERRVQNYYGVRCDPSLPVRPRVRAARRTRRSARSPISRRNFVELCAHAHRRRRAEVRRALARGRAVGRLVTDLHDDRRGRAAASQRAFLRNLERGEAYQAEAPTLWDIDFRTAVAQAELEDREMPGAYHAVRFQRHRRRCATS